MSKPVIGIIGGTIHGNRGAQAMLETVIGRLRESHSDLRFVVFSYYPETDQHLVTDPAVKIVSARPADLVLLHFPGAIWAGLWSLLGLRWPSSLLPDPVVQLRDCRLLIDIAGISFSDGREKFLPFNILTIWPAMLLGVPVYKFAQALGPFRGGLNRLSARLFLSRCGKIFGRGATTMAHLTGLPALNRKVEESTDLAFLHHARYSLSQENEDRTRTLLSNLQSTAPSAGPLICICPSNVLAASAKIDYTQLLSDFARGLGNAGKRVVLVPTATRQGSTKAHNNDLKIIEQVEALVNSERTVDWFHCVRWDLNFAGVKSVIEAADAVVTFRFHGLVAALSLSRPVLAVGWGHKYRELMSQFDLEELDLDFREMNVNDLLVRVDELLDRRDMIRDQISTLLPKVAALSERQLLFIESELNDHASQ